MDKELQRMLDELKANVGRSVEALPKIAAIEERLLKGDATLAESKKAVEELRGLVETQKKEIEDIRKAARVQAIQRDGVGERKNGLRILGMQVREMLCHRLGIEMPVAFRGEAEQLKQYRATLNADDATGSYLVPTITESEIIDTLEEVSPLVAMCDFQPGLPGKMDIPTLTGRPALRYKRATVDTAMGVSEPSFGQLSFDPDEMYCFFAVDNRLLQMSAIRLGELCVSLIRDGMMQGLADAVLNATGAAAYNSMTGILAEATAAYVLSLPAGKTAFSDITKADLSAAKAKALLRAQNIGKWIMGSWVRSLLGDLDRTGKEPVISRGAQGEDLILGNGTVVEALMPAQAASGAGKGFLAFGDLKTMFVGMVGGIQLGTSTEFLFNKNQTAFRGVINGQIVRKPFAGLITVKTAAQ